MITRRKACAASDRVPGHGERAVLRGNQHDVWDAHGGELGIALDVLVGTFIFGIFFFQIRETFDSLDIHHLEKLKDRE
jgi:hypothetical protein